MAQFVVLEDFINNRIKLRAGKVIDDGQYDIAKLQAGGLALFGYDPATMDSLVSQFRAIRRPEAEAPISLVSLFAAAGHFGQLQARDIYISPTGKDDANGRDTANRMSLQSASDILSNKTVNGVTKIFMEAGTYPFVSFKNIALNASLYFIGEDKALRADAGDGIAGAGSTSSNIVNAGLVINALHGSTIEMTSGAALGERSMIRSNTATGIVPSTEFTGAVAATDTYIVYDPEAEISFGDEEGAQFLSNVSGAGGTASILKNSAAGIPGANVVLSNVTLATTSLNSGISHMSVARSSVLCYGVQIKSTNGSAFPFFISSEDSVVSAGYDVDGSSAGSRLCRQAFADGVAPSDKAWIGWGLFLAEGASTFAAFSMHRFRGIICGNETILSVDGANWRVGGGSAINTSGPAFEVANWGHAKIGACSPPYLAHSLDDDATFAASLSAHGGGHLEVSDCEVIKTNAGVGIAAFATDSGRGAEPGLVGLGSGVTVVGVSDATSPENGILAGGGGDVNARNDPGAMVTGGFTAGKELAVRSGSGLNGTLIEDEATLAAGTVLPLLVDTRHGAIRNL